MPRSIHSRAQIGQGRAPSEQRPWRQAFQRPAAEPMAGTSAAQGALDLERQLLDAQQLASLGMLACGIAHDCNTLLGAILGNAQLALSELTPESPAHLSVAQIVVAAQRASGLTRQILAYVGKGDAAPELVDVGALVTQLAQLLGVGLAPTIALRFELAAQLPPIAADASQIGQVALNLIVNAAEALGESGGAITLRTRLWHASRADLATMDVGAERPAGTYIVLEVADTGSGMDAGTRARIFRAFYTTKPSGRGLGLAVVRRIVERHQGALQVQSAPGCGTTVMVLLPVACRVQ